jgi:hypothetical protein
MNRLHVVWPTARAYVWVVDDVAAMNRDDFVHERPHCPLPPAAATVLFRDRKGICPFRSAFGYVPTGRTVAAGACRVPQALALAAQLVMTLVLLVMLTLNLFVLALAFRTKWRPESRAIVANGPALRGRRRDTLI